MEQKKIGLTFQNNMDEIQIFINRMKRIGIELGLSANVPWIYLYKVNRNKINPEDYSSNHGYTIAWYPVRLGSEPHLDEDIKRTFNIIRKYR
jgi:hypothetical protein